MIAHQIPYIARIDVILHRETDAPLASWTYLQELLILFTNSATGFTDKIIINVTRNGKKSSEMRNVLLPQGRTGRTKLSRQIADFRVNKQIYVSHKNW